MNTGYNGKNRQLRQTGERGFTLVELVAASVILFVGVLGVLSLTRTGRQIDTVTLHRRAARNIIVSRFESITFHFSRYQVLKQAAGQGTTTQAVTLDNRGTPADSTDDLAATLGVTVGTEADAASGGISVPYLPVTLRVVWNEPERAETLAVTKWITQL